MSKIQTAAGQPPFGAATLPCMEGNAALYGDSAAIYGDSARRNSAIGNSNACICFSVASHCGSSATIYGSRREGGREGLKERGRTGRGGCG
eukprot:1779156-Rhodomonas_salina.1